MADQSNTLPTTAYDSIYVSTLLQGYGWVNGPVAFHFGSGTIAGLSSPDDIGWDTEPSGFAGDAWSDRETAAFYLALEQISAVCNLTFEEVADPLQADMVWGLTDLSHLGAAGMHEFPDGLHGDPIVGYFSNTEWTWADLTPGTWGYHIITHELGHGLGLAHPHHWPESFPGVYWWSDLGKYGLNQGIWTTMSYNTGWDQAPSDVIDYGWEFGPMAFDVAALQALYGANMTTRTGSDAYRLPDANQAGTGWSCIWDAGGIDAISHDGSALACTIDLRPAPLTGPNAGGFVSRADGVLGGFTIANGVVIERAIGGSGNDTLIGNAASNVLDGGLGADTLRGGTGDDVYIVDDALDTIEELVASGQDEVQSSISWSLGSNLERLTLTGSDAINGSGNGFHNVLRGNGAANQLNGRSGNDVMAGGGGADRLTGGTGADVFRFEAVADSLPGNGNRDVIADFSGIGGDRIDVSAIDADPAAGGDQAFTFIGESPFSGTPGELRFASTILAGDVDGDGRTDFAIKLAGVQVMLQADWLVL